MPPGIGMTELSMSPMTIKPGPPSRRSHVPLLLRMSPITIGFAHLPGIVRSRIGEGRCRKNEVCPDPNRSLLIPQARKVESRGEISQVSWQWPFCLFAFRKRGRNGAKFDPEVQFEREESERIRRF